MKKKILVTGTAGFIGFHLVQKLIGEGHEIVGLDNINDYYDVRLKLARLEKTGIDEAFIQWNNKVQSKKHDNYSFIKANLQDKIFMAHLFESEQFDEVCHLAAQPGVRYSLINPHAYIESNILGFINILEGCRHHKVKHLTYASSSSVYGLNEKMPLSENDDANHPVSLYAATKKSNELMAHTYSHLYNIPTTGLRFFTVYGPWGRPDMALNLFTNAILNDQPIKVFNNGEMIRDFTYVDDIVTGVSKVMNHPPVGNQNWRGSDPDPSSSPAPYKIYNIGNHNPVNLMDFIDALENEIGKIAIKEMMPIQPGDVTKTFASVENLSGDLNYKPNKSIQEGINQFVTWYKQYYKN